MALAPIFPNPPAPGNENPRLSVSIDGTPLSARFGVQWQDVFSKVGSGQFSLLNDHEAIGTLDTGQTVIFELDSEPFLAWVIDGWRSTEVAETEEVDEATEFYGKTTLSELARAVILPANGVRDVTTAIFVGRLAPKPYGSDRYYGPMEPSYDDSGWSAATQIVAATGTYAPENWPTKAAYWIGSSSEDVIHIRREFTTSGVFTCKLFFAATNSAHVFVDGTFVGSVDDTTDGDAATKTRSVKFEVTDGTHTIYARVARGTKPDSAFLYSIYQVDSSTLLSWSSSSAKMTAEVLDVTPGYVADRALTEMQTISEVNLDWSWDFDAVNDSAGRPWPTMGPWYQVRVKDTVLSLLDKLCEGWAEMLAPAALGGRTLQMWVAKDVTDGASAVAPGHAPSLGVSVLKGTNATQIIYEKTAVSGNRAVFEFQDGLIVGQLDDSVTDNGPYEVGLDLSSCDGPMALYVAEANLRQTATPELSIVAEWSPSNDADQVAVVQGLGGYVTARAPRGGDLTAYRLQAHSGGEDNNGVIMVRPELNSARDIVEQRYQRWLNATSNGTNDGRSAHATISSRHVKDPTVVSRLGGLDFSTGGSYSIVGDRGSRRRPTEPGLIVRFEIECDVAGIVGTTRYKIEVDGSSIGTVDLASGAETNIATLAAPVYIDQTNLLNIECVLSGQHSGCTVKVLAVPIG